MNKECVVCCNARKSLSFATELPNLTRMHSSRMRTGRSLTVCCNPLPGGSAWSGEGGGGGLPGRGGLPGPGGLLGRGVCLVRGGSPCWGVLPGLGGSPCPGGGGLPGPGAFSLAGGVLPGRPPPCEQNDRQV